MSLFPYHDAEGNVVSFPSPELDVDCDIVILPEACPEPIDLTVDGCEDTLEFDAGDLGMESLGRIIQLSVTLAECLSQQAGCFGRHSDRGGRPRL